MRRRTQLGIAFAGLALAAQLWQPARTNPAHAPEARLEAVLSVPSDVEHALRRACYDCHSNETAWPWYARLSPVSFLLVRDVEAGRAELNFSSFGSQDRDQWSALLENVDEVVQKQSMPLSTYRLLHPGAVLTADERRAIERWTSGERSRLAAVSASDP
jgi:hypothetical protein